MAMIRVEWEVGKISVREPVQLSTSVQLTPLDCTSSTAAKTAKANKSCHQSTQRPRCIHLIQIFTRQL